MRCFVLSAVLAVAAGPAMAASVNPALPLFTKPGAVTKSNAAATRSRLMLVVPSSGARFVSLRFYPDPGIGRMDAGMFRLNAASAPAYGRFVDDTVGTFGSAKRDLDPPDRR
jgi:hypothetical protein